MTQRYTLGEHNGSVSTTDHTARKLVSISDWTRRAARGAADLDAIICAPRRLVTRATDDSSGRVIELTIGSSAPDRSRDVIHTKGYQLDNYRANPVVLWAHDWSAPPIGRALDVRADGEALVARDEFAPAEVYPFADTVYQLLRGGYLNAASVGVAPIRFEKNEERGGVDFLEVELLEHSIVPIPSNPQALAHAKAAGLSLSPLDDWARRTLDETAGGDAVVVSRAKLEAAVKALGYGRGVAFFDLSASDIKAKVKAKVRGDFDKDVEPVEPPVEIPEGQRDQDAPQDPEDAPAEDQPAEDAEAAKAERPMCEACGGSGYMPEPGEGKAEMPPEEEPGSEAGDYMPPADGADEVEDEAEMDGAGGNDSTGSRQRHRVASAEAKQIRAELAELRSLVRQLAPAETVYQIVADPPTKTASPRVTVSPDSLRSAIDEALAPVRRALTAATGRIV